VFEKKRGVAVAVVVEDGGNDGGCLVKIARYKMRAVEI